MPSANQVSNVSFTAPTDYAVEAEDIERRRKLAEQMRLQGAQEVPRGTEMVGGWAVKRSPLEGLAGALKQGVGAYQEGQLSDRKKALAAEMRADRSKTIEEAMAAMQGSPEVPTTGAGADFIAANGGPVMEPDAIAEFDRLTNGRRPGSPAIPADPRRAYGILAASQDPSLQQMGLSKLLTEQKLTAGKPGDILYDSSGKIVTQFPDRPKFHTVGPNQNLVAEPSAPGQVVTPAFTGPDKASKEEAEKLGSILDAAGIGRDSPEGKQLFSALAKKMATHQPATTVNVDARERQKVFENENKLRDDYVTASKPFVGIRDAYNTVKAALSGPTTAASTLAGATKFMKMIDPESVVRESELNMALKTSGMLDRFMNIHNTVMQGQVLTPRQKTDMLKITQTLYDAAEKQQKKTDDYFGGLAKQYQLAPDRVVRNQGAVATQQQPGTAPTRPAPPGVAPNLWAVMTPEERAVFP